MGYARELKYQICKRIYDEEITVEGIVKAIDYDLKREGL